MIQSRLVIDAVNVIHIFCIIALMVVAILFQGMGGGDQQKEMQERQQAMEDMKNSILSQVLTQQARARCKTTTA